MEVLNRIGVGSAAKLSVAGGVVLGLLAGIIYSFGGAIIDILVSAGWVTSDETPGPKLWDSTCLWRSTCNAGYRRSCGVRGWSIRSLAV